MLAGFKIGSLTVPPETLGWTRAPDLDVMRENGPKSYAYRDVDGKPYLFAPGVTPGLRVPTIGDYSKRP